MNPLDVNNLNNIASTFGLKYGSNSVLQLQAIFSKLAGSLWNNIKNVNDIINNWNNIVGNDVLINYEQQLKNLPDKDKFNTLLYFEVDYLIKDFLQDVKDYSENTIISIDDIYGTIYTYDPYLIDTTKWSIILNLFKPKNSNTYKTLMNRTTTKFIKEYVTDVVITSILEQISNIDVKVKNNETYELIRKYLSSKTLNNVWDTKDYKLLSDSRLFGYIINAYEENNSIENVVIYILTEFLNEVLNINGKKNIIDEFSVLEASKHPII